MLKKNLARIGEQFWLDLVINKIMDSVLTMIAAIGAGIVSVALIFWMMLGQDIAACGMSGWYVKYYPKCNRYYICRKALGFLNVIVDHDDLNGSAWGQKMGYYTAELAKEYAETALKKYYEKKQYLAKRIKEEKEKPKISIDYKQISGMVEIEATKKHLAELHKYYNIPE
jgi:hypothetical protein